QSSGGCEDEGAIRANIHAGAPRGRRITNSLLISSLLQALTARPLGEELRDVLADAARVAHQLSQRVAAAHPHRPDAPLFEGGERASRRVLHAPRNLDRGFSRAEPGEV